MFSLRSRIVAAVICLFVVLSHRGFAEIDATKGKRYPLNKKNGPWMIFVAPIRDVPEGARKKDGMTAWEVADRLVYELRSKGVPAYTYLQDMQLGAVKSHTSSADDERKYIARHEAIAVLAGNFTSPDDPKAKPVLDYLKTKYDPAFLKDPKNGGITKRTPGRPLPFSGAMMTTNPLMSQSDVKKRTMDPQVRRFNSSIPNSLLKNTGKYSLKVATFHGNSIVQTGNIVPQKAHTFFNSKIESNLTDCETKAWELTEALRSAKRYGYERDFDAYVFHDRYESYVTIGSFDSVNDPRIVEVAKRFGGKANEYKGEDVSTAEVFSIPRNPSPGTPPEKFWMFDLKPTLVKVPQVD